MDVLTVGVLNETVKPQAIRETALAAIQATGCGLEWADHEDNAGPVAEDMRYRTGNSGTPVLRFNECGKQPS
jgi:hypothetical protein